jgi:hypothetical protein
MGRTKPIGVRFDPEKLEFIKSSEKLKSNQQVIDLLVNRYWWEHKMPVPTHKEAPPLHLKEAEVKQTAPPSITPISPVMNAQALMLKYVDERREVSCQEEFQSWSAKLQADNRLNSRQKQEVLNTH